MSWRHKLAAFLLRDESAKSQRSPQRTADQPTATDLGKGDAQASDTPPTPAPVNPWSHGPYLFQRDVVADLSLHLASMMHGIFSATFPDKELAETVTEGFLENGTICFTRVRYRDGVAAAIATSTYTDERSETEEFQRLREAHAGMEKTINEKFDNASKVRTDVADSIWGPMIKIHLRDILEFTETGPFPVVREIIQSDHPYSLGEIRVFVRGQCRYEVGVFASLEAPWTKRPIKEIQARAERLADEVTRSLQAQTDERMLQDWRDNGPPVERALVQNGLTEERNAANGMIQSLSGQIEAQLRVCAQHAETVTAAEAALRAWDTRNLQWLAIAAAYDDFIDHTIFRRQGQAGIERYRRHKREVIAKAVEDALTLRFPDGGRDVRRCRHFIEQVDAGVYDVPNFNPSACGVLRSIGEQMLPALLPLGFAAIGTKNTVR